MNYQRIYNQLIDRALTRTFEKGVYFETHHIIPTCIGGLNDKSNKVKLTYREHFLAHWLLHRIHPLTKKLSHAFLVMSTTNDRRGYKRKMEGYIPSSRALEEAKLAQVMARIGTNHSEETKAKIKAAHQKRKEAGVKHIYNTPDGKRPPISEETKEKMRLAKLGKKRDPELMKAIGRKISENIANGVRPHPMSGRTHSEETRQKLKAAWVERRV